MRAISSPCVAFALLLAPAHGQATGGVPRFDHVVIVIEENHAYSQIIGSASAPYINSLAAAGALMTQSYAISHPSQPNYVAFFSGATQGVTNDSVYPHSQFTAPNLGAKLRAAGFTFGGYSETMPSVGFDGASAGTSPATYQRKHNPWVDWQDPGIPLPANKLPAAVNMPYAGYFPAATAYDTLPTLSIVVPNQLDDMHDGTVAQGDAWAQANLSAYAAWCGSHNSLLVLTFDEDDGSSSNHIATIFLGANVLPGQYSQTINHYNVLRTLENMYGLPHDAGSVTAAPITNIWDPASVAWTDLGYALAGVNGPPHLAVQGAIASNTTTTFQVSNAAASALGVLVLSPYNVSLPIFGGILVPNTDVMRVVVTTGAGGIQLTFHWPAVVLSGISVYGQAWILDAAGVQGAAATNAVATRT
jgi:acid phosphatase